MPASSSSWTSCQRLAWRLPGALVWASSSTRISAGCRARAASRSSPRIWAPRYSTERGGGTESPSSSVAASGGWVVLRGRAAAAAPLPRGGGAARVLRVVSGGGGGGRGKVWAPPPPLARLLVLPGGEEGVGVGPPLGHAVSVLRSGARQSS